MYRLATIYALQINDRQTTDDTLFSKLDLTVSQKQWHYYFFVKHWSILIIFGILYREDS